MLSRLLFRRANVRMGGGLVSWLRCWLGHSCSVMQQPDSDSCLQLPANADPKEMQQFKQLESCLPSGRPGLNSWLPVWGWPSPGCCRLWESESVNGRVFFVCVCICLPLKSLKALKKYIEPKETWRGNKAEFFKVLVSGNLYALGNYWGLQSSWHIHFNIYCIRNEVGF